MTEKPHILFLCGWYPSGVSPHNGDFIQRHAEAVNSQYNVSVLHIISDGNCTKNIEFTSEEINEMKTHIAYVKPSKNPFVKAYRFYTAFKFLLKKIGKFDVVHLNEIYPFGLFTFLLKQPFIVSEHWTGYHQPQAKNIGFWQRLLSKRIVQKATFICPVSKELQNSMETIGLVGNYTIVPNVVDTNTFFPSEKQQNDVFTILHISNMNDAHKNVSGIIRAVANLNFDYKLILIGINSSKYKSVSDELHISQHIDFIEHLPHNEIPKFLQKADVYVSFSNYETWGIVMMEAIACGTPVISTNTGIVNELGELDFTKIINKKDEKALTKAIEEFKGNSTLDSVKMHQFVKTNFSNEVVAKQFSLLYQKSLS